MSLLRRVHQQGTPDMNISALTKWELGRDGNHDLKIVECAVGNALTHQVEENGRFAIPEAQDPLVKCQSHSFVLPLMHNSTAWTPARQLIDSECASERKKGPVHRTSRPYTELCQRESACGIVCALNDVKGDAVTHDYASLWRDGRPCCWRVELS